MSFMNFNGECRELLKFISEALFQDLNKSETLSVEFRGEETDYVRWNQSKVRQNTSVLQREMNFELQCDGKRSNKSFSAQGVVDQDLMTARTLLQEARADLHFLPVDPFLVPFANHGTSLAEYPGQLLEGEELIPAIAGPGTEVDLAGLYAGGTIVNGNRNSLGQDHWFANESFFVDYSLYDGERAVKSTYAAFHWNQKSFNESVQSAQRQLVLLNRPSKKIEPGKYKVYLAPAALSEISQIFDMGALSYREYKNGACAFKKLMEKERTLSPLLSISENFKLGLTPRFNSLGELAAEHLPIITEGVLQQLLVNSRSAKEYGVPGNFASSLWESPRALDIAPGTLSKSEILKQLGTGLYLSNLHYLNWSDLQNARVTGMTRYACMWVENGEIVAPIEDMRFDVSML
ncbi:MAG: Zn-dependent protease, partial [Bdellovibrionaceae bacterium]|nr:Zn-dependent protease [Pseudobdellovibrionaceae bacterium]